MMMNQRLIPAPALILALAALLPGCSAQQVYGSGQAWQRNECNRLPGADERRRCLESNSRSYEDYRRESQAAKDVK